jgi:hypothetical protein
LERRGAYRHVRAVCPSRPGTASLLAADLTQLLPTDLAPPFVAVRALLVAIASSDLFAGKSAELFAVGRSSLVTAESAELFAPTSAARFAAESAWLVTAESR